MEKRGISPLVATVLLIGFAIVLGALVWVFFSGTVLDYQDKTSAQCSATDAAETTITVSSCTIELGNPIKVNITAANIAQSTIDGFRVRMITANQGNSMLHVDTFDPGDSRTFSLKQSSSLTETVKEVEVAPFLIEGSNKVVVCDQNTQKVTCK